jgi:hypothetical protein
MGSVVGSTILAMAFVQPRDAENSGRYIGLFVILAMVAMAGIMVNSRIADRRAPAPA